MKAWALPASGLRAALVGRQESPLRRYHVLVRRMTRRRHCSSWSGACMAYYDYRVFGNAFTLPYQVNRATYAMAPVFLWKAPLPEPIYRHKVMRDFYVNWELRDFQNARTLPGFLTASARKAGNHSLLLFRYRADDPSDDVATGASGSSSCASS